MTKTQIEQAMIHEIPLAYRATAKADSVTRVKVDSPGDKPGTWNVRVHPKDGTFVVHSQQLVRRW